MKHQTISTDVNQPDTVDIDQPMNVADEFTSAPEIDWKEAAD